MNAVVVITPFLLLAMAVEHLVARRRGRRVYSAEGLISDMTAAAGKHLLALPLGLGLVDFYGSVGASRLLALSISEPLHWLVGFVVMDFVWYWRHRAGHRIAALWAIHEVHHQSREMNLGVAQRLSWFQGLQTLPFALCIAMLGVPVEMFGALYALAHLYQFTLHSPLLGDWGPLERLLMTPRHHRVHHGCNPAYIDRNYGHTLIVWDRLFGTFAAEVEPVVFGLPTPLERRDALTANLGPWRRLLLATRRHGVQALVRPPGWRDAKDGTVRSARPPRIVSIRRLAAFWLFLASTLGVLALEPSLPLAARVVLAVVWLGWAAGLGHVPPYRRGSRRSRAVAVLTALSAVLLVG